MTDALEQVLADAREQANALRITGNAGQATYVDQLCDRVAAAAEPYLRWLSESEARLYSGLALRTLRRRFRELLEAGNARYSAKGDREYRMSGLPRHADVAGAREAGRRGRHAA